MRIATSALVLVVAATTAAHAQVPEAEALFREGKKLMKRKAYAAACDKFEASERIDPAAGTELNLADCREKNGQLASAWAMFVKARQTAKHLHDKRREAEARSRATALEPKLVYLTIAVPRRARIAGLVVRRNDAVLDAAAYDQPVPVDPDAYTITAEAPGHERWQHTISVGSTSAKMEVPRLDEVVGPAPAPPPRAIEPPPRPAEPSSWTGRRKAAVALGVAGVAADVTGIVFGLHANDLDRQSAALCPGGRCTDSDTAFDLSRRARSDGLIANIGMIGGGALVAGAVALWITGKPHERISITARIGPSGIAVGGTF